MLRRLLASLLVAALAMPVPAVAVAAVTGSAGDAGGAVSRRCAMPGHAALGANHRCCCDAPSPDGQAASAVTLQGDGAERTHGTHCAGMAATAAPASSSPGCGCELKADPGRDPAAPATATVQPAPKAPLVEIVRLPASLSTPRREIRRLHVADPPPAPGLVSRPLLCSWTL